MGLHRLTGCWVHMTCLTPGPSLELYLSGINGPIGKASRSMSRSHHLNATFVWMWRIFHHPTLGRVKMACRLSLNREHWYLRIDVAQLDACTVAHPVAFRWTSTSMTLRICAMGTILRLHINSLCAVIAQVAAMPQFGSLTPPFL